MNNILGLRNITPENHSPEEFQNLRFHHANGLGGLPLVGDPDFIAAELANPSVAGFDEIALSLVNYADELPYFAAEVLPRLFRLGLREKR